MFTFEHVLDLPLIWGGIIALAVFLYVVLDGFDLGVGILFPFAPTEQCRDSMMHSIAPFWDGNETWLVLGGGGLFAAFPLAYALIMPAVYIPIILMLIALIFRGVAFEFRFKAEGKSRKIWDYAFHFGSLFAAFAQGMVLGTFVQGIEVHGRFYTGGPISWLTPFSIMTGLALISGYALLGATWIIMKTKEQTQVWAEKCARYMLVFVILFMCLVTIWMPFLNEDVQLRWFSWPNIAYLSPIPILVLITTIALIVAIFKNREILPFFLTIFLFALAYIGLIISIWPWIVPYDVTLTHAAASGPSLSLLLVGAGITVPIILAYTAYSYYVFRGKAHHDHDSSAY